MTHGFDSAKLTEEKNLWDIYVLTRRIKNSRFNLYVYLMTIALLSFYSFTLQENYHLLLVEVRIWSEIGLNVAMAVLGFLIAGFTIFATLTKPKMLLSMMSYTHPQTGLPFLKYNLFCFMRVFIYYIIFIFAYILILIFGHAGGLVSKLIAMMPNPSCVKVVLVQVSYVLVGSSFVILLLQLKSFIFNVYSIVMNSLRWEIDGLD